MPDAEVFPFFCPAPPGLENVIRTEMVTLGLKPLREEGGFFWKGTWRELYRANLCLRTVGRILVRIKSFEVTSFAELEAAVKDLPWDRWVKKDRPFRVRVTCRKSKLYHQGAVEERFVEGITKKTGAPYSPSAEDEEEAAEAGVQLFVVRIAFDRCTISADTSGEHLHRRGYRLAVAKAPLRETLAAALLYASGWVPAVEEGLGRGAALRFKTPGRTLVDPFCGSGTLVIEAALIAAKVPPGLASKDRKPRDFSFLHWPSLEAETWKKTVESLQNHMLPSPGVELLGSDRDQGAVDAALSNAYRAGVEAWTGFERQAFSAAELPQGAFLVTNPPYGVRVSEEKDLRDLFASFGNRLRDRQDLGAAWLSSEEKWLRATGLTWKTPLAFRNGGLEVRVAVR